MRPSLFVVDDFTISATVARATFLAPKVVAALRLTSQRALDYDAALMNPADVATTLPDLPAGFVPRDNVIMTIDDMFSGEVAAVLVKGLDGAGKTTLLSSYVRAHADSAISLFLKPLRLSYEPTGIIAELSTQLRAAIGFGTDNSGSASRAQLAGLVQKLAEKSRLSRRRFVFVVDGLGDVLAKDKAAAAEIIELLPFGHSTFRFVLSGDVDELVRRVGAVTKPYQVTLWSIGESRQLFAGLDVQDIAITTAHRACNGVVGQLAAIRRLVQSGLDIGQIIEKHPGDLGTTMLLEWDHSAKLTHDNAPILAILAFDARRHSVKTLAACSQLPEDEIHSLIASSTFLTTTADGSLDFVSDNFRTFAQKRLQHLRQSTLEKLISQLLKAPLQREAATALPQLMSEAKQFRELITLLEPNYLYGLVVATESVGSIATQATIAAQAAEQINDEASVFRFRLMQSLALQVGNEESRQNEVEALIAVDDVRNALSIARGSALREERLRLLASALAGMVENGKEIEPALKDELSQLCNTADVLVVGDDIVDIASDVFVVDPESALSLADRYGQVTNKPNSLDWLIASVSLAQALRQKDSKTSGNGFARLHERISDPRIRSFSQSVGLLGGNRDADWIRSKSSEVADPVDRLSILRLWLQVNNRKPDAVRVAEHALDLALQTPEFAVTVPILRQLAAALPYSNDANLSKSMISRIEGLASGVPNRAPTIEYVRLQILLARTEIGLAIDNGSLRLVELYLFIGGIADIGIKAESMARLFGWLPTLEPTGQHGDLGDELRDLVREVLQNSAEQDQVIPSILEPLVQHHAAMAFGLIGDINTDWRRETVRSELLIALAGSDSVVKNAALLVSELGLISDSWIHARTLVKVLGPLSRHEKKVELCEKLRAEVGRLGHAQHKAECLSYLSRVFYGTGAFDQVLGELRETLSSIQDPFSRSRAGFRAATEIAAVNVEVASELLNQVRVDRDAQPLRGSAASGFNDCIKLAGRALRGVLRSGRECNDEIDQILNLSTSIPDTVAKVTSLSELCYWLLLEKRPDVADRIYSTLAQVLKEAKRESLATYSQCLTICGWALFRYHQHSFVEEIQSCPMPERERILRSTVRTVTKRVPPTEPSEDSDEVPLLEYKDCTDILTLVELVSDDVLTYRGIRAVSRAATVKGTLLTREQRLSLQQKFTDVVARTLPSKTKIRHEGYKWACTAELLRMNETTETNWREIITYAKQVPNVPDAAYTLALIAVAIPSKFQPLRKEAMTAAVTVAEGVRIAGEKIDCLSNLAEEFWRFDSILAQKLLRSSSDIVNNHENEEDLEGQVDHLLDIAYRISPDFAETLSSSLDQDAARSEARAARLKSRLTIDARREMVEDGSAGALEKVRGELLADAALKNLAGLNIASISPKPPTLLRKSLDPASRWPLQTTYAVFAWVLQNYVERAEPKQEKAVTLRALSQSALLAAELIKLLASGRLGDRGTTSESDEQAVSTQIGSGERLRAIEAIREWCSKSQLTYLKIADQYFGPDDLALLKSVAERNPKCEIKILTSLMRLRQLKLDSDWSQEFMNAWIRYSADRPPAIDVTVIGVPPKDMSPIHDRWWISNGGGLDFGTSANSLGYTQESKLRELSASEATDCELIVDRYLNRTVRWVDAGRISYLTFSI